MEGIQKSAKRKGPTQEKKEQEFSEKLNNLFDIASADALEVITITEDKEFLIAQREPGRQGSMLGVDKNLANAEKRKATRQKEDLQRQEVEKHQAEKRDATVELASSSSSTSTSPDEDSKGGMSTPKQRRTGPRPSTSYMSPELVAALDRTKTSNRGAVHLVEATVSSLGHDKATLALNRESIRRSRRSHRALLAEEIKKNFSPDTPLIVHWDGKIVPHVTGGVVDRLAILEGRCGGSEHEGAS
ncbi:uncharacterized protein LOC143018341 [Oratosquilla oratoria]|uniref:uncharacterized protein LOC143018341 n=1 Tax=Oratosquilla oratoria TaxID=337810 RepID=UPI003F767244